MTKKAHKFCRDCRREPTVEGRTRCVQCAAKNSAREKEKYAALKAAGCCRDCKKKVSDGKARCTDCRKVAYARGAKRNVRLYRLGFCSQCWVNKREKDASRCSTCEQERQVRIKKERKDYFTGLLAQVGQRKKKGKVPYGVIYHALCKITNKSYIGQSKNYHKRVKDHISKALRGITKTPFALALKKYGPENFEWNVITLCYDRKELDAREYYYINRYGTLVEKNGYNLNDGVVN